MGTKSISISMLRTHLFRVVDHIIATGEPIEIEYNGHRLMVHLVPDQKPGRLEQLNHYPEVWLGTDQDLNSSSSDRHTPILPRTDISL